jgi:cytochrome c oxidase accessory protein FixG
MDAPESKGTAAPRQSDEQVTQSLYAKQEKIYPREVHGLYARLRTLGVLGLLGIYYITPWLQWDGHQAILLDLPARKFHILWFTFWPQGDRMKQKKLDAMPMNARKFRIKATKHTLWLLFSLWTGFTFVGYFSPIVELGRNVMTFNIGPWETFWIFFYGFATYGNAGWMREQVCKYMCPYARFQSAMFDKDTLIISYDELRGEPRGSRKRSTDPKAAGLGDCIDCTLCVQVCPTGIDIRKGLQYECIACSACIDACDDVMDKMGYPKGLIRYTTENALEGLKTHIIRPRIVIYAVFLAFIMGLFIYSISNRVSLGLDVIRDRNRLYRETDEGLIENVYILKVLNMDAVAHDYELSVSGIEGLEMYMDMRSITVPSGDVLELPVRLRADEAVLQERSTEVIFELVATDNPDLSVTEHARFLGPR